MMKAHTSLPQSAEGGGQSPGSRDRILVWTAFGLGVVFSLSAGLFAAGSAMDDPGGWRGFALIATWLAPMVVLTGLACFRPQVAKTVLASAVGVLILIFLWSAVDPSGWRATEDEIGPIRAIMAFTLAGPVSVLGLRHPGVAGTLLGLVGGVGILVSVLAAASAPLRVVGIPIAFVAVLFLASLALRRLSVDASGDEGST